MPGCVQERTVSVFYGCYCSLHITFEGILVITA
nr:MAG TPA: hypothetical protein [Caudoviricetes sp.]